MAYRVSDLAVLDGVAVSAGATLTRPTSGEFQCDGAKRIAGALANAGAGSMRVDIVWLDKDRSITVVQQSVGSSFDLVPRGSRFRLQIVETGSSDPLDVTGVLVQHQP